MVKAKKYLGQHFLMNEGICRNIANALQVHKGYKNVLEIGPGTGALTKYLLARKDIELSCIEIDGESIDYLEENFPQLEGSILDGDFLKVDWYERTDVPFAVIGNFPYNISTQILFKVYEFKDLMPEVVGMFQKEVAERVASPPGKKAYGILSVLLQAFYDIEYLFTVDAKEFEPPPRVQSGVIRLKRNDVAKLDCDADLFLKVVKTAFNQRRKTLRNSLSGMLVGVDPEIFGDLLQKRPEQLKAEGFVVFTNAIAAVRDAS